MFESVLAALMVTVRALDMGAEGVPQTSRGPAPGQPPVPAGSKTKPAGRPVAAGTWNSVMGTSAVKLLAGTEPAPKDGVEFMPQMVAEEGGL